MKLEVEKKDHIATITHLKGEVLMLNSKLDQMTKSVKMLTNRTDKLEEILQTRQNEGNMSGIGFVAAKNLLFSSSNQDLKNRCQNRCHNIGLNIKEKET